MNAVESEKVRNPWRKLHPSKGSYVLEMDREDIRRYNAAVRDEAKVIDWSIPEPFIGNPESARVVLLGLNPGHSNEDKEAHSNDDFREAMLHNLDHESQEYPFYPLNPGFEPVGVVKWWGTRTRKLRNSVGLGAASFAKRLLVIEGFPYHSKKSALPTKQVCKSQEYSFQLAKEMLGKRLVVLMRSQKHWLEVDPEFGKAPRLKNPQCGHVSEGNMDPGLYKEMVAELQRDN